MHVCPSHFQDYLHSNNSAKENYTYTFYKKWTCIFRNYQKSKKIVDLEKKIKIGSIPRLQKVIIPQGDPCWDKMCL